MKILSLSHDPLPDSQVEKAAYTAKKKGHTIFLSGLKCVISRTQVTHLLYWQKNRFMFTKQKIFEKQCYSKGNVD